MQTPAKKANFEELKKQRDKAADRLVELDADVEPHEVAALLGLDVPRWRRMVLGVDQD
jgi:hypothetical protein